MIVKVLYGLAALVAVFVLLQVILRIVAKLRPFPAPAFAARLFDGKLRWRLQKPYTIVERLGLRPGMVALEAGPGRGFFTTQASMMVGPEGKLLCVDIQPALLEGVQDKMAREGLNNAEPILGDIQYLPIADGSVDLAFLVTVLGEIPDKARALTELHRVLKPGGILSVTELLPDPHYSLRDSEVHLIAGFDFEPFETSGNIFNYTINFHRGKAKLAPAPERKVFQDAASGREAPRPAAEERQPLEAGQPAGERLPAKLSTLWARVKNIRNTRVSRQMLARPAATPLPMAMEATEISNTALIGRMAGIAIAAIVLLLVLIPYISVPLTGTQFLFVITAAAGLPYLVSPVLFAVLAGLALASASVLSHTTRAEQEQTTPRNMSSLSPEQRAAVYLFLSFATYMAGLMATFSFNLSQAIIQEGVEFGQLDVVTVYSAFGTATAILTGIFLLWGIAFMYEAAASIVAGAVARDGERQASSLLVLKYVGKSIEWMADTLTRGLLR